MKKHRHKFQERMMSEMTYEEHFRNRGHEMICLARELEKLLGREKTLEVLGAGREQYIVAMTQKERGLIRDFEDFKAREKAENASPYFAHILTLTYPKETADSLTLHVTECLWAKVFKELNAAGLGYVLHCQPDFAYANACHPKIKLSRTKTLMQGDDCCNHTFYWDE